MQAHIGHRTGERLSAHRVCGNHYALSHGHFLYIQFIDRHLKGIAGHIVYHGKRRASAGALRHLVARLYIFRDHLTGDRCCDRVIIVIILRALHLVPGGFQRFLRFFHGVLICSEKLLRRFRFHGENRGSLAHVIALANQQLSHLHTGGNISIHHSLQRRLKGALRAADKVSHRRRRSHIGG